MFNVIFLLLGLLAFASNALAESVLPDWLTKSSGRSFSDADAPADSARLLTLEPNETEMYPQPSPNGHFLLTMNIGKKYTFIARRHSENGDPANMVTEDGRALDSIAWGSNAKVHYLSNRSGNLAIWEKVSDGEGMQVRLQTLFTEITQPILLTDKSIIAVRLNQANFEPTNHSRHSSKRRISNRNSKQKRDAFNNWNFEGYEPEIVRIDPNGEAHTLARGINPSLSPDGKWIVFAMPVGLSIHLFRMHTDGSNLIQITDTRSVDVQPSWSRDGKSILFTSNRADPDLRQPEKSGWDIWMIDADGRNIRQLTFDKANDGAARMDKNGRIYFHSNRQVTEQMSGRHQVRSRSTKGYHIWVMEAPLSAKR